MRPLIVMERLSIQHPEGLLCPVCGCDDISYWPEVLAWDTMSNKEKLKWEVCPACGYGNADFPYEEFCG